MSKGTIIDALSNAATNVSFKLEQYGPEIGFWGGLGLILVGTGVAVFQCCKRVPEIKKERDISKKELEIRRVMSEMTDEEYEKESAKIVRHTFFNYAKAFVLPAGLIVGGTVSEIAGFTENGRRLTEAVEFGTTTMAAFAAYRKKTAEELGEDKEKEIYYDAISSKVKKKIKDENGNTKTVTDTELEEKEGGSDVQLNPYTYEWSHRTVGALCCENDDMFEYNLTILKKKEEEWNNLFENEDLDVPMIWLSDVLRSLALEKQDRLINRYIGWLNPKYYKTPGNGSIDFRITPMRYIDENGIKRWKFMLDFNCDGNILELAKNQKGLAVPMCVKSA